MTDFNPYAAPEADISSEAPRVDSKEDVWSDGRILVVRKGAALPDRCVKCNAPPAGRPLKKTLMWHSPAWYLVVLLNLILYVIVAMIVRKTIRLQIPLCAEHKRKRRNAILVGWLMGLGSIAVMIVGATLPDPSSVAVILLGIVMLVGGILYGTIRSRLLYPERIDKEYARLKGAGLDFLMTLPDLRGKSPAEFQAALPDWHA